MTLLGRSTATSDPPTVVPEEDEWLASLSPVLPLLVYAPGHRSWRIASGASSNDLLRLDELGQRQGWRRLRRG